MRRLAIIDVHGSQQPIFSPDARHALVFNGEIYNFRELRAELAALGHVFTTNGDAEVVLTAWLEWGEDAWARLDGMFAVAIWDEAARTLRLARDPMGIKPLYYTLQSAGFAFASELKALTLLPGFAFDTDTRALHDYFSFGHIRQPRSIYRDVATLPPGHVLTIAAGGDAQVRPFAQARYAHCHATTREEWVERFREAWLATVAGQMVADVDLGAFLSGGIDSSAVVAAMARVADRPVRTFAIGFPDPRFDESAHAEAVAAHLGCDHITQRIDLADATDVLPQVQSAYDEPFADPSAVPTWYVSRLAAEHVKVALSGDGGDELFFGYRRHRTERAVGRFPAPLRHMASRVAHIGPERWHATAAGAGHPDGVARFVAKTRITSDAVRRAVLSRDAFAAHDHRHAVRDAAREYYPDARAIGRDTLDQFALADLTVNLPAAMLTKVDRASMAHSLEVRVPMLGQAMVALALAMPAGIKLNRGTGKDVVRRAIAPWLPPGITARRKQGFRMPLGEWFRGDFGSYALSLWRDGGRDDYLDAGAVERLFAEHRSGKRDHGRFLYALAIYCLWKDARRAS